MKTDYRAEHLKRIRGLATVNAELYLLLANYEAGTPIADVPLRGFIPVNESQVAQGLTVREAATLPIAEDLLVRLYLTADEDLTEAIAGNPNTDPCVLSDYVDLHADDDTVMALVAANPNTDEETLLDLAADERFAVSLAALTNDYFPAEHIDEQVRRWEHTELTDAEAEQFRDLIFGLVGGDAT